MTKSLARQEALRLVRFCLGPDDSGSVDIADDGAALVTVARADGAAGVRTFEAPTFEAALRQAADAGMLKAICVERQIAFMTRGDTAAGSGASTPPPCKVPRDAFPRLIGAVSALLHETQVERGMSAIFTASAGKHFRRELARQRARADRKRDRFVALGRELGDALGSGLSRRFGAVAARLREIGAVRSAIDAGEIKPIEVVTAYSSANAELLGVGDGAMVVFADAPHRASALACVVLLYAKEKTGIERARLGASFATRSFSDEDRRALAELLAARSSYLHVFSTTAPLPAEELLERAQSSATTADLALVEDLVLRGREQEVRLDARAWFALASRKIEQLGEVGAAALDLYGAG